VSTTVKIYFPRYLGADGPAVRTPTAPEIGPNDATVLVVEDNGDVREYIVSSLTGSATALEASTALTMIVDGQAASPSSWKAPFTADRMAW
jgi:hypothetical protein